MIEQICYALRNLVAYAPNNADLADTNINTNLDKYLAMSKVLSLDQLKHKIKFDGKVEDEPDLLTYFECRDYAISSSIALAEARSGGR